MFYNLGHLYEFWRSKFSAPPSLQCHEKLCCRSLFAPVLWLAQERWTKLYSLLTESWQHVKEIIPVKAILMIQRVYCGLLTRMWVWDYLQKHKWLKFHWIPEMPRSAWRWVIGAASLEFPVQSLLSRHNYYIYSRWKVLCEFGTSWVSWIL